ncbi:hypothetical protein GA0115234_100660 [Streptomyces sp. DvalAA-43]|nr:hypothetical protein GA0115234_100660 [Streptomyces sp. DvalAA-43]
MPLLPARVCECLGFERFRPAPAPPATDVQEVGGSVRRCHAQHVRPAPGPCDRRLVGGPPGVPRARVSAVRTWAKRGQDFMRCEGALTRLGFGQMAALPRMAAMVLRTGWEVDRRTLTEVVAAQSTAAWGLVAVNGVLTRLFTDGPTADKLRESLPFLVVLAVVALLSAWSAATSGRLEPQVEQAVSARSMLRLTVGMSNVLVARGFSGLASLAGHGLLWWLLSSGDLPLAVGGTAVIAICTCIARLKSLVQQVNRLYEEILFLSDAEDATEVAGRHVIRSTGTPLPRRTWSSVSATSHGTWTGARSPRVPQTCWTSSRVSRTAETRSSSEGTGEEFSFPAGSRRNRVRLGSGTGPRRSSSLTSPPRLSIPMRRPPRFSVCGHWPKTITPLCWSRADWPRRRTSTASTSSNSSGALHRSLATRESCSQPDTYKELPRPRRFP